MRFEKLDVWKRASRLTCRTYVTVKELKDYGFRDQITRSALSVPSNLAEGEERASNKEKVRFLFYSKSSVAELITQIYIGIDIGYIQKQVGLEMIEEAREIAAIISRLIKNKQQLIK